jgi:hypothetical protein
MPPTAEKVVYVRIRVFAKIVQKKVGYVIFGGRNGNVTVELAGWLVDGLWWFPQW